MNITYKHADMILKRLNIILFMFVFSACISSKAPVNKTFIKRVTPSEKLARAYKKTKKVEKEYKSPEAMLKSLEKNYRKNKSRIEFQRSIRNQNLSTLRRNMRNIYSSYH
jgi:hypothetical protein